MGFNIGSSKLRQLWKGDCVRYHFESPLVRLMKDHGYRDVYHGGDVMPDGQTIAAKSIVIHRYYERTSRELGDGRRLSIEEAAAELAALILRLRDRVCDGDAAARDKFRVYLVAHSMGGLVCRCLLQNPGLLHPETRQPVAPEARSLVDKLFTYATPHNGIDLNLLGNVPGFVTFNDANNFDRDKMRGFLALPDTAKDVDSLNGQFDPARVFCLVGTNDRDYGVLKGIVREAVGPMSDGLVRIDNATTWGPKPPATPGGSIGPDANSPRAFVHRSHSGQYGIVNSEEGFQNLTRFLFGDVRVDGTLRINRLSVPPQLEEARAANRLRASYHFEVVTRVRGSMWDLHRRVTAENSAIFRTYDDLVGKDGRPARPPQLFSAFLSARNKVNRDDPTDRTLGFSIDLRVLVPQYEVDRKFWLDQHYDGGYLFRDKINLLATPPGGDVRDWSLQYGYDSRSPNQVEREAERVKLDDGGIEFHIPVVQNTRPGIDATLVLNCAPWNV